MSRGAEVVVVGRRRVVGNEVAAGFSCEPFDESIVSRYRIERDDSVEGIS